MNKGLPFNAAQQTRQPEQNLFKGIAKLAKKCPKRAQTKEKQGLYRISEHTKASSFSGDFCRSLDSLSFIMAARDLGDESLGLALLKTASLTGDTQKKSYIHGVTVN